MENTINTLEKYLLETLGCPSLQPAQWRDSAQLPFYLQDTYVFFQVRLFDRNCLLALDPGREEPTPATINKNMTRIRHIWPGEIIYVRHVISAYNRKRLIEHKVPFIIPGNQMYLPMLGIDLREYYKKAATKTGLFSPATQVAVLYELLRGTEHNYYTPSRLAHELGYTVMTQTRAFDELEKAGIAEVSMQGRERILRFKEKGRQLWEMCRNYLRTPVQKRLWIKNPPGELDMVHSGLTALDTYTMLSAAHYPTCAVSREDWKNVQKRPITILPNAEPDACEIEVWRYSPRRFGENNVVDRLSLYLSLRDDTNERIAAALEELIRGMKW